MTCQKLHHEFVTGQVHVQPSALLPASEALTPTEGGVMSLDEARCDSVTLDERRADIIRSAARGQGPTFIAIKLDMLIAKTLAAAEAERDRLSRGRETLIEEVDRLMGEKEDLSEELSKFRTKAQEAEAERDRLTAELAEMEQRKDAAYEERNRVVTVLSKLWPSHWCWHPEDDAEWSADWRTIICIHSPVGQLTWHIHLSQQHLFAHLPKGENHWDGHTTEQKYQRLESFTAESSLLALEATVGQLIEKWKAEAVRIREFHATLWNGWDQCANELADVLASVRTDKSEPQG